MALQEGKGRIKTWSVGRISNRGFSLLELIVVLLLIGMIYSLVPLAVSDSISSLELKTSTRRIVSALRYTRNRAIFYKKAHILLVDNNNLLIIKQAGKERALYRFKIKGKLEINVKNNSNKIIFFPLGNSSGGEIEIRDRRGVTWIIRVNPFTGRVSSYFKG